MDPRACQLVCWVCLLLAPWVFFFPPEIFGRLSWGKCVHPARRGIPVVLSRELLPCPFLLFWVPEGGQ
eukprot:279375-Alexandrium_andersonii.AAC.1